MKQVTTGINHAKPEEWDRVMRPAHYNAGNIETIDKIKDTLSKEQLLGYYWGNVIKYMDRWPYKNGIEDLRKAKWYLERLIEAEVNN